MFEKLIWVISGVRPVGWMGCMLVGCSYFLITRWNAFAEGAEESELWVWNSHLLCVWAWVNSIIISEAVIMCPSIGRAVVGPPCFRQQVQLTIWQLTPMEGVIQTSLGWVDPVQAVRAKANKPANLWHRRRAKTTWRRWWRPDWRTAASSRRSLTVLPTVFLLYVSRCPFSVIVKRLISITFSCHTF